MYGSRSVVRTVETFTTVNYGRGDKSSRRRFGRNGVRVNGYGELEKGVGHNSIQISNTLVVWFIFFVFGTDVLFRSALHNRAAETLCQSHRLQNKIEIARKTFRKTIGRVAQKLSTKWQENACPLPMPAVSSRKSRVPRRLRSRGLVVGSIR